MTENINVAKNIDLIITYIMHAQGEEGVYIDDIVLHITDNLAPMPEITNDDRVKTLCWMLLHADYIIYADKRFYAGDKPFTLTPKGMALYLNGGMLKEVTDRQTAHALQQDTNTAVKDASRVQTFLVALTLIIVTLDYCEVRRTANIQQSQESIERAAHRLQEFQFLLQYQDSLYHSSNPH